MNPNEELDPQIGQALEQLKHVPPRNVQATARGRAQFLTQAAVLRQGVSAEPFWRHIQRNAFFGNVRPAVTALALVILLIFGGSSLAVYAAQDALPGDTMYPLKIWSEDTRLNLTTDPEARVNLLLELANRRADELITVRDSTSITAQVTERQQAELQSALQIAAQLDDADMARVLAQAEKQLVKQIEKLQSEPVQSPQARQGVEHAIENINAHRTLIEIGLQDQKEFRHQIKDKTKKSPDEPPATSSGQSTESTTGSSLSSGTMPPANTPGGVETEPTSKSSGSSQKSSPPGQSSSKPAPPDPTRRPK